MSLLLPCPAWKNPEDPQKLPGIAQAASRIYDFIIKQCPKSYLLTYGDLKTWHKSLFENAAPVKYYAGNFRGVHPTRPCLDVDVAVSGVAGTEAALVEEAMKTFSFQLGQHTIATDKYIAQGPNEIENLKAAVQLAAFAGGSIIKIHPFINGNGRIARLTMNFFLHRYGYRMPFYIDRPSKPDYSSASAAVMSHNDFTPLYQYLVELLAVE